MSGAILFTGKFGASRQYAEWIAKKTGRVSLDTRLRMKYGFDYLDKEAIQPIVEFAKKQMLEKDASKIAV